MNQLQTFDFSGMAVRVVSKDGTPWWVARDVCSVLEISNNRDALSRLDDDEKGVVSTDTLGGKQDLMAVNEPGLFSLILGSRKPEAKRFKRWVTHEVLPAIRKTGMYATDDLLNNPDLLIQAATKLKEEREARKALETKVELDRPKVVFAEALEVSENSVLVRELSKILKQNDIDVGEQRLFEWLRHNGYLITRKGSDYNLPSQKSMELKIMEIKVSQRSSASEGVKITRTTKITGKGIGYFINKFKGECHI
ncbi:MULTISPECIES: phage antirepressor KilAC domain-containing protein [unclassified Paenibacillus]|uniref:phage antirepressor KilAC domain-containing protein n=1 Tax=unclassified Paenibacillus TaxID=185978 RepID=UPI0030F5E989